MVSLTPLTPCFIPSPASLPHSHHSTASTSSTFLRTTTRQKQVKQNISNLKTQTKNSIAPPSSVQHPQPTHIQNMETLESLKQTCSITVLKIYSKSCRSCKRIERPFARISAKYLNQDVLCFQLCADDGDIEQNFAQSLGVRGFPTFIFYQHGKRVDHMASNSADAVEQAIVDLL